MKIVKNIDVIAHVYAGMTIEPDAEYTIQALEEKAFALSDTLISDIGAGKAQIKNAAGPIAGVAAQVAYLVGTIVDAKVTQTNPYQDSMGYRVRYIGFSGTAQPGTTTDIDYLIAATHMISGANIILDGHESGDTMGLEIWDKDNVLGFGAIMLDQFGANWQVDHGSKSQGMLTSNYWAQIYAGLYLRIKYTSTGQNPVAIGCNLFLHRQYT